MAFVIKCGYTPNGKQVGYSVVYHATGEIYRKFADRSFGGWKGARAAAERCCDRLNGKTTLTAVKDRP